MMGERVKIEKWIRVANFVVCVEVDAVMPGEWPWKPQLAPAAIRFLDEVQEKANKGLISELEKVGEVYVRRTAQFRS